MPFPKLQSSKVFYPFAFVLCLAVFCSFARGSTSGIVIFQDENRISPNTCGPVKGYLFLHGGGKGNRNIEVVRTLINLARKNLKPQETLNVVLIVSADKHYDGKLWNWFKKQLAARYQLGLAERISLKILHTRDRQEANEAKFCQPLANAHLVVIQGGLTRFLQRTYVGTRVETELNNLLNRGGVIAGGSAGALIQSTYLARAPVGAKGFNFLKNSIVDVHVSERNRKTDLPKMILKSKYLTQNILGIGIDESTAVLISFNTLKVVGKGNVFISEPNAAKNRAKSKVTTLSSGDRYDLLNRKPLRKQDNHTPSKNF